MRSASGPSEEIDRRRLVAQAFRPASAPPGSPEGLRYGRNDGFTGFAVVVFVLLASGSPRTQPLSPVHLQRYCMGTMFDIVAYSSSHEGAERAAATAMEEIFRLDRVMSDYKADSELSKLNREGGHGFVRVDPSLFEVIQESMMFSRRSGGKFDVTVAPLIKTWRAAQAEGRRPSADEIADARRCVGYENIEAAAPDRIRFRSDCVRIDLGGIGKGYAVDRAIAVLGAAGIRHALVNAGGSSIAAIGAPPGHEGWPVRLGASVGGSTTLLLRDRSISTSQQKLVPLGLEPGNFGDIVDPRAGAPIQSRMTVSVVGPGATTSDALSTALVLLTIEEGSKLIAQFADVSALWISPAGELQASYRESQLQLSDSP
jgi:thiamine biosynthesis lipoprotein